MGNPHIIKKEDIFKVDNALDKIRDAFNHLEDIWQMLDDIDTDKANDILGLDYPFNGHFGDLTGEVRKWVGLCKGRLLHHLIEIVKKEEDGKNERSVPEN